MSLSCEHISSDGNVHHVYQLRYFTEIAARNPVILESVEAICARQNADSDTKQPDPVDQVMTLLITLPPSGATKRVSGAAWAVGAVDCIGRQKAPCFYSWTLLITTLTLRIRLRPSGSAPI